MLKWLTDYKSAKSELKIFDIDVVENWKIKHLLQMTNLSQYFNYKNN